MVSHGIRHQRDPKLLRDLLHDGRLADARRPGQGVHVAQQDGQVQVPQGHGAQHAQGGLGTDA